MTTYVIRRVSRQRLTGTPWDKVAFLERVAGVSKWAWFDCRDSCQRKFSCGDCADWFLNQRGRQLSSLSEVAAALRSKAVLTSKTEDYRIDVIKVETGDQLIVGEIKVERKVWPFTVLDQLVKVL